MNKPSWNRTVTVVLAATTALIIASPASAQAPQLIYACVQQGGGDHSRDSDRDRGSQQVRIVAANEPCRRSETRLQWNVAGPAGPAGPQGPAGPIGPAGPAGAGGSAALNKSQRNWDSGSNHPCCGVWHPIPESAFTAATSGGDLLVFMDLSLNGGSHATCRAVIDGQWAGSYSGMPTNSSPYWLEAGLEAVGCCGGGWRKWNVTRLYPKVPAGAHTFSVECATDGGTLQACSAGQVGCSWGFVELP